MFASNTSNRPVLDGSVLFNHLNKYKGNVKLKEKTMREISVKFWDEKLNIMWQPIELKKLLGYCIFQSMPNSDGYLALKDRYDKMKWLYSTGLKDSKGVEIYEGDILKDDNDTICHWRVFYNEKEFCWDAKRLEDTDTLKAYYGFDILADCEIIGSIYENPELLQDSK